MIKREKIVVIGSGTPLEHEICNLGRSLGHQIVSVSEAGRPQTDEPWVDGIAWIQPASGAMSGDLANTLNSELAGELAGCFAVIVCDHVSDQDLVGDCQVLARNAHSLVLQMADAAEGEDVAKFVWVRTEASAVDKLDKDERSAAEGDRIQDTEACFERYYKEAEDDLLARRFRATILRPTVIFGQGIAMSLEDAGLTTALPLEYVAMAALRASLEPDTCGIMERDAIELYGDAMIIQ